MLLCLSVVSTCLCSGEHRRWVLLAHAREHQRQGNSFPVVHGPSTPPCIAPCLLFVSYIYCQHDQLNVPYDIAGVTFLAFGNGAPDVFSAIAAYSSGVGETGINELLGGAMFVSTVVVGCVAIASAVRVDRWPFSRDVSALLASLVLLLVLATAFDLREERNEPMVLLFLVCYALYVVSVLVPECVSRYRVAEATLNRQATVEGHGGVGSPRGRAMVLSAFWHALSPREPAASERERQAAKPYTFITRTTAQQLSGKDGVFELASPKKTPAPRFANSVFEDHFQDESLLLDEKDSLSSPLISDEDRIEHGEQPVYEEGESSSSSVPKWIGFTTGASIMQSAYWRHMRWRWSLKRRILGVFYSDDTVIIKVLSIPQALLVLVRDVTIPLVDQEAWSRPLATLSPITVPLFILLTSGSLETRVSLLGERNDGVALWQLALVLGAVASIFVSFTTHRSRPPKAFLFSLFFLSLAFASCVCWIYAVANELMALLIAVGVITHASNGLLGLTVLSWGNSVGDLITNVSVARAGFPQMAIAGCFGGPVFNILLGLGVPMGYAFFKGQAIELELDTHSNVSLGFLFVTLTSSYLIFRCHNFCCPPWYGKLLVVFYVVYTIVNLAIAFRMYLAGQE